MFFHLKRCRKKVRLGQYLRDVPRPYGQPATAAELTVGLGMSESDIMDAAFRSKRIKRRPQTDMQTGRIVAFEFELRGDIEEGRQSRKVGAGL
ncbi:MAG: hypothetical protein ABW063_12010 [Caulobacter sp.]